MSGSTSKIICANGSTTEGNSELNVPNKPLDVEQCHTDEIMGISDSESIVTIGEVSDDEYYDEIIFDKQPVVPEELYSTDQNEQSGSPNYVNVGNNDASDNSDSDGENLEGEDLIVNDISLALPAVTQEHSPVDHESHEQPTQRQSHENTVCHRHACNNLVMPVTPLSK